ncbi:hypothetical protein LADH09A_004894 [Micromonospora sp. LAH09]|uniref:hypothetical protein n=1 Tax=Micromonospora cabrerizensis TaxID=2911213 RepID=UPI001EE80C7A|nr:hypothetical protein [Micromonospora cabrerizensis]MCG5470922.1 hypothetical protein [Micromonospora cabrerizensis]
MKLDRKTWLLAAGSVALIVLALALFAAAISAAYRAPSDEEQPKVTDWMQAWGSIAGVVAGLAAAGAATALLLHEWRRAEVAERQLAEERAESALSVPRAIVVLPALLSGGASPSGEQHIYEVETAIYNHGSTGVRNVAFIVSLPEGGPRLLLPRVAMIGPGGRGQIKEKSGKPVPYPGPSKIGTLEATVTVCFIDHTNQAWQIASDGEVSRTTEPYPAEERAVTFPLV